MLDKNGETNLYFVVETKGSTDYLALRPTEQAKIKCGRKHFEALGTNVHFDVVDTYEKFKTDVVSD